MEPIQQRYRYIRECGTRKKRRINNTFYFNLPLCRVRMCKLFFRNTLDINDRPIRTVLEKTNKVANTVLEEDKRGNHGKQATVNEHIKEGNREHIRSIP